MELHLHPLTTYLREVLWVLLKMEFEEDAHWLFRFKQDEVVAWSDQDEARPPDWVFKRAERGPVGKLYVSVRNGQAYVTNLTFKDIE
jgi:hypothetical protein